MAIKFLKVSPEQAVEMLQECARKGYALRYAIQGEHDSAGASNVTDEMVEDWIKKVNDWTNETRVVLLETYYSPNYMYNFLEATPNLISTGEEQRFTNLRHGLLQRIGKLNNYVDFIIQNSNPTFSFHKNITYMHLNPERDLNLAGRDVKTQNK